MDFPKLSGIYKIESKVHPDRIYIGSAVNLYNRKGGHIYYLRKKVHKNPKLQAHYNKHGEDDLIFSVLTICDKDELIPINGIVRPEQFFIWAYNPWFNVCQIAGNTLGVKHSKEARVNNSKAQMGNKSALGHTCTLETRLLMSKAKRGMTVSQEVKDLLLSYAKQKKTDEHKRHISEAKMGDKNPMFGKKQSTETKEKRKESRRKTLILKKQIA